MNTLATSARDGGLHWPGVTLADLQVRRFDDPVAAPVRTSFGTMVSRPGLLVRLTDDRGNQGFGEVWCNFPEGGARYRATLLERYARPALRGGAFERPEQIALHLHALLGILREQCADHGAIAQLVAGVDQAAWDLFCKRAGQPFWRLLKGQTSVPVYASGIGPHKVADTVRAQQAAGHTRFKIKLGFDEATDTHNLAAARSALPEPGCLMVDVNQGWTPAQAHTWLPRLAAAGVLWCEEPLRADTPWSAWRALAESCPEIPLAAGENLLGLQRFLDAAEQGSIRVLQPDLGKWGGISENLELGRRLPDASVWVCPHWLAGGVGLMASLQLKAVIGGAGWVEMDANPNRQRSDAFAEPLEVRRGAVQLPDRPGLVPPLAPWVLEESEWQSADEVAHAG